MSTQFIDKKKHIKETGRERQGRRERGRERNWGRRICENKQQ